MVPWASAKLKRRRPDGELKAIRDSGSVLLKTLLCSGHSVLEAVALTVERTRLRKETEGPILEALPAFFLVTGVVPNKSLYFNARISD